MITYLKGDATDPQKQGIKIIAHVCNNVGAWGAGFVLALSKKWQQPEQIFRKKGNKRELGQIDVVEVENDIVVVNMVAQNGLYHKYKNPIPLNYEALAICLEDVYEFASSYSSETVTVHLPKIGAGLARGDWTRVEKIIEDISSKYEIETFVYTLD